MKHSPVRTIETVVPESPRPPPTLSSPPKLDYARKLPRSPEPQKEPEETTVKQRSPSKLAFPETKTAPEPASQVVRAGAKRKYGDENGTIIPQTDKENSTLAEKSFPTRGGQKRKSLADLAGVKQERKTTRTPLATKRTPLAAKSTNEDVSSPRKVAKAAPPKGGKIEQSRDLHDSVMTDDTNMPKPPTEISAFAEPPGVVQLLETATALPSAAPSSPTTPDRLTQKDMLHDTPPPADISSTGETSRPSRRTKAAISYAEPNLRDKMRRPTKELLDAVAGEGKYVHRAASNKSDDHHSRPTSSSKTRSETGGSTGSSSKMLYVGNPTPKAQQQALLSPLAQKDVFVETLPSTVVMERRKRPSAVGSSRESLAALNRSDGASREPSPATTEGPKADTAASTKSSSDERQQHRPPIAAQQPADIYDFTASSPSITDTRSEPMPMPSSNTTATTAASSNTTSTSRPRTTRKSSMAAAAALRELLDEEDQHDTRPPPPKARSAGSAAGRKRASMLAPKKSSMLLDDNSHGEDAVLVAADADTSGSSVEGGEGLSGREGRIARRRSMML